MGSGCLKVTKYFLFLFNLLFLVSIVGICRVERKAWTKISWKTVFFLDVGPVCLLKKMARVLEGRRESLKLRDIRAAVGLLGTSSSSAPSTHLLSPMHTAPSLQWEGKTGVMGPFWKESSHNYFLCHFWSSS